MVGLKPSDVPPPLGVKVLSAGTAACIADLVTFPLDTAKVRLQVPNVHYNTSSSSSRHGREVPQTGPSVSFLPSLKSFSVCHTFTLSPLTQFPSHFLFLYLFLFGHDLTQYRSIWLIIDPY